MCCGSIGRSRLFDPELFHSVAESRRWQTEYLRGATFASNYTLRALQNFSDIVSLHLFQSAELSGCWNRRDTHGSSLLVVLGSIKKKDFSFGQQHRPLNHVF